ncbi:hypothetical protein HDU76_005836 [Blyttiomyces sp. JEL0837]|nr:hypothetical protein HDU76_005836 [Blyttiomyces sp. JEL0837]
MAGKEGIDWKNTRTTSTGQRAGVSSFYQKHLSEYHEKSEYGDGELDRDRDSIDLGKVNRKDNRDSDITEGSVKSDADVDHDNDDDDDDDESESSRFLERDEKPGRAPSTSNMSATSTISVKKEPNKNTRVPSHIEAYYSEVRNVAMSRSSTVQQPTKNITQLTNELTALQRCLSIHNYDQDEEYIEDDDVEFIEGLRGLKNKVLRRVEIRRWDVKGVLERVWEVEREGL